MLTESSIISEEWNIESLFQIFQMRVVENARERRKERCQLRKEVEIKQLRTCALHLMVRQ